MKLLRKYFVFVRMSWTEALLNTGRTFGRMMLYLLLIAAFQQLWKTTALSHTLIFSIKDVIWYLTITEWITLSVPRSHLLRMEEEARDGSIAYFLMRPISFLTMRLAEGIGNTLLNLVVCGISGCAFAYFLTGGWPEYPAYLPVVLVLGVFAAILELLLETVIGITAFWLHETRPFYWVYQKLMFVFGGLLFPLQIYPMWMQKIAAWTPFSVMLCGTANMVIHPSLSQACYNLTLLLLWLAVVGSVLVLIFEHCRKRLEINGG